MKQNVMLWSLVFAAAALPSVALACGATPDGQYKLLGFSPADGAADVAPNEPIFFRFACDPGAYEPPLRDIICVDGPRALLVSVKAEGSATALAGDVQRFGDVALFQPLAPLSPNTTYVVTATFREGSDEAQGEGPHEASFQFRTGATSHAEPSIATPATSLSELYEAQVAICKPYGERDDVRLVGQSAEQGLGPQYCPGEYERCEPDGTAQAPRMRLTGGHVSGPLDALGYQYTFAIEDSQGNPRFVRSRHVAAGEPVEFTWDYPANGEAGRACARLTARDGAGRELTLHDACFDVAEERAALLDGEPNDPGLELDGCQLGSARGTPLLSVFGLVALWLRRRRER